jgi:hypothetical protein
MIYTTLNKIRAHLPYAYGWSKLLAHVGKSGADDEPLALTVILDSNGLDDTLWCLRSVPEHNRLWHAGKNWAMLLSGLNDIIFAVRYHRPAMLHLLELE